ncbi:MAG: putative baseplate assembly protein [Pseudomonadota bacterium]|uniref:putative baseplate assembly protein n=1 Tax=Sphingomonas sp. ERG5 TaxID=1381597 RepID=UPI00054B8761|nr:putative baseplate assembly protein [Sphingomonas sp. ERG5]
MTTNLAPQIDYTDKDFEALRGAMLEFAKLRLPEWTDRSTADFGMLMVDLFAFMGDVVLYYQDRIANESFLQLATERRSIVEHLRLIGYELGVPAAAVAEIDLDFDPGLMTAIVPTGARFRAAGIAVPQLFEYPGPDLTITFASNQVEPLADGRLRYRGLPLVQGESLAMRVIGGSTGEPNQGFALPPGAVLADTLAVEVDEGAGWVRWDRRESLLYDIGPDGRVRLSDPDARHYYVRFDETGNAELRFGDGRFGRRPPRGANNIRAAWREGGGAAGNVAAGTIREIVTPITNLAAVANPNPAAGGSDSETTEDAVRFGPAAFRSRDRAVTAADYEAMAHLAGGVAKARARARSWNVIDLFVAPAGPELRPLPEPLRRRLISFFEDRRMAGAFVRVLDARPVLIDVTVEIGYDERRRADEVRLAVEAALGGLLAYTNVEFGKPVYLSAIHDVISEVAGVRIANVTRFKRRDASDGGVAAALASLNLPPVDQLPLALRAALRADVEADGRIELADDEIAVLGERTLILSVAPQ